MMHDIESKKELLKQLQWRLDLDSERQLALVEYIKRLSIDVDTVKSIGRWGHDVITCRGKLLETIKQKIEETREEQVALQNRIESDKQTIQNIRRELDASRTLEEDNTNPLEIGEVRIRIFTYDLPCDKTNISVLDIFKGYHTSFIFQNEPITPTIIEKVGSMYTNIAIKQKAFCFNNRIIRIKPFKTYKVRRTVKIDNEKFELEY